MDGAEDFGADGKEMAIRRRKSATATSAAAMGMAVSAEPSGISSASARNPAGARRECLISAMNIWPYGLGRYEHRRCVVAGLATLLGFLPLWRFSPSVRAKAKVGAARRLLTPAHGSWTGLFDAKGPTLGRPHSFAETAALLRLDRSSILVRLDCWKR
jgi:hypothetical protein